MKLIKLPEDIQQHILSLLKRNDFVAAKTLYDRYLSLADQPHLTSDKQTKTSAQNE